MDDLESYLARIGYAGARAARAEVLESIHRLHGRTIPFENLDVLSGKPIRLGEPEVIRKLVHERRGGYCFEQGVLLAWALRALGFSVQTLTARVRPPGATVRTGLTHMLLRVDTPEGSFFADTGFGGLSLSAPLLWKLDVTQPEAGLEPRRLVAEGDRLVHQGYLNGAWSDIYEFRPEEAPAVDLEIGNWYVSTHSESRFVNNLTVARLDPDRRHGILNREYTVRHADGRVESTPIDSADHLLDLLARHFGLHFPAGTRFGRPGAAWPS